MSNNMFNQNSVTGNLSVSNDLTIGGDANVNGDLVVLGKVDAYNTKRYNVGVFSSVAELQTAYPSSSSAGMICVPLRGWVGGVITTTGGTTKIVMYRYNGSNWVATAIELGLDVVLHGNIAGNYALKSYVDAQLSLKASVSDMNTALAAKASTTAMNTALATKADASDVYKKANVEKLLGRSVGEAIRIRFNVPSDGMYQVINAGVDYLLISAGGSGCIDGIKIKLDAGNNDVSFVFPDPAKVPNGAFSELQNITHIHIPSFVHTLGNDSFSRLASQTLTVDCEAMTPPANVALAMGGNTITQLKVHRLANTAYSGDADWSSICANIADY